MHGIVYEKTAQPKYPKDQKIGSIVIEEIPEEKSRDIYHEFPEKPMTTPKTIAREDVTDISRPFEKEGEKFDVHEPQTIPVESRGGSDRLITATESVERLPKAR